MTSSYKKPQPPFTCKYIEQAPERTNRSGVVKEAIELGILENNFYHWRRKRDKEGVDAFRGHGKMTPEMEEIARLRRDSARLKEECDIFKKAATLFASENQ